MDEENKKKKEDLFAQNLGTILKQYQVDTAPRKQD